LLIIVFHFIALPRAAFISYFPANRESKSTVNIAA